MGACTVTSRSLSISALSHKPQNPDGPCILAMCLAAPVEIPAPLDTDIA